MGKFEFIIGKHYSIDPKSGCWNWCKSLNSKGYPQVQVNSALQLASRISYSQFIGKIKTGLVIDHLCRNPKCINPKHLEMITYGENTRRGLIAKLSRKDVEYIRGVKNQTQQKLASKFKISQSQISRVKSNKTYIYEI